MTLNRVLTLPYEASRQTLKSDSKVMDLRTKTQPWCPSTEIIDLRTIRPLDKNTIISSVKKTNRCITIEEGFPICSVGNNITALIMQEAFDYLDAPVINCTGKDVPMPYAENLEKLALVNTQEVVDRAKEIIYR